MGEPRDERVGAHWVWLAVILGAGAALRVWGLGELTWWFDEALTWRTITLPWPAMVDVFRNPEEGHPPLYYLLLRGWAALFGDSEAGLRSFSAVCGVVTIAAVYAFTTEAAGLGAATDDPVVRDRARRAGLFAAALVAAAVSQIQAGRQARMYSLGTAELALGLWFLLRALRGGPAGRRWWVLAGGAALAFCYTHALGLFVVALEAAFVVGWRVAGPVARPPVRWGWAIGVGAGVALGCAPLVPLFAEKATGLTWAVRPTVGGVPVEVATTLFGSFMAPTPVSTLAAWGATVGLFGVLVRTAASAGWPGVCLGGGGLGLFGLMAGYSFGTDRSIVLVRYLTFTHILWAAAVGYWLAGLRPAYRWAAAGGLVLVSALVAYPPAWAVIGPPGGPGMRAAADFVRANRAPGEVVFTQRTITQIKARYYLPAEPDLRVYSRLPCRHLLSQPGWLLSTELIGQDEVLLLDAPGVWVLSTSWFDEQIGPDFPVPPTWVLVGETEYSQDFYGEKPVRVWHYRIRPDPGFRPELGRPPTPP